MSYTGNEPSRSPLIPEQFGPGDFRYPRLDGANVAGGHFKNALINGCFDHWQRGAYLPPGIFSTAAYCADRWALLSNAPGSAFTASRLPVPVPGAEPQLPGSESPYYARLTYSGSPGQASEIAQFRQPIESVARFSGRRIAIRGRVRQISGGNNIAIFLQQNFGVGGSAAVNVPVAKIPVGFGFQPFSAFVTLPSIAGKTLGPSDQLILVFVLSAGSDYNPLTGGLGTQNIVVDFADLEVREVIPGFGDQLGPFERVPADIELLRCQRYYSTGIVQLNGYNSAGLALAASFNLPTTMRGQPTMTISQISAFNSQSPTIAPQSNAFQYAFQHVAVAAGALGYVGSWTANAEL